MTAVREGAPPEGAATASLQHWIYGASPEKGYGMKAESHSLNGPLYLRYLAGHFTPVRVEKTSNGSTVIDARMIHPASANDEILLSVLGRGVADEYNRPTIQNHTVVVPAQPVREGRLTFYDVEAAAEEFDRVNPKARGKIDALEVRLRTGEAIPRPPGGGIRRLITKAAVDTLVSRLLADLQGRTLVLCRGSSNQYRNELLYRLVELIAAGGEIPLFPAISDAPTLSAMNHFRVAISARGVRADATWTLLDASIDHAALPPIRGKNTMYARVGEAFAE